MTEYVIEVTETDPYTTEWKFCAVLDSYDGAQDGNNILGLGDTHYEAIDNLLQNMEFKDDV